MKAALFGAAIAAAVSLAYAEPQGTPDVFASGETSLSMSGSTGGIVTPWATIGDPAPSRVFAASATLSTLRTDDYRLQSAGASISYRGLAEFTLARTHIDSPAGLDSPKLDALGLKLKVAGRSALLWPALQPDVSLGLEYKRLNSAVPTTMGLSDHGTDLLLSASDRFLRDSLKINMTLRLSDANQGGFAGFGSGTGSNYKLRPELSASYRLARNFAVGAEYRINGARAYPVRPDLAPQWATPADDWKSVYLAWAPHDRILLRLAYVDLGHVSPFDLSRAQRGYYLSLLGAF